MQPWWISNIQNLTVDVREFPYIFFDIPSTKEPPKPKAKGKAKAKAAA